MEEILKSEQYLTLLKIAKKQRQDLCKVLGEDVNSYHNNETVLLYISYPQKHATWTGKYWDIPQYVNGSTRHARCLFLITPDVCIGQGYCVQTGSRESYEKLRLESEHSKINLIETIQGHDVQISWTWEWDLEEKERWFIYPGEFFLETRINGKVVWREKGLKSHIIVRDKYSIVEKSKK